eukprot:45380-Eustigmatos_ZCMA.PRE.1
MSKKRKRWPSSSKSCNNLFLPSALHILALSILSSCMVELRNEHPSEGFAGRLRRWNVITGTHLIRRPDTPRCVTRVLGPRQRPGTKTQPHGTWLWRRLQVVVRG